MITMSSFKHAGLIISIITSLISCTHNKNYTTTFQPELAKAEAIMYRYPDSALHILQGIQPDNPSDNEQYATWALLMTQAQYKMIMLWNILKKHIIMPNYPTTKHT